jgi:hypothetical protein
MEEGPKCAWCNLSANPKAFQVCNSCEWTDKVADNEHNDKERVLHYCVRYCSKECREKDSKYHQLLCKKIKPYVDANPRPSMFYHLALLLPQEGEPELVWMRFSRQHCGEYPDPCSITGAKDVNHLQASYYLEQQRPGPRNQLDHNLLVLVQDDPKPVSINTCITKTVNGASGHTWRGPIIACSQVGRYYQPPYLGDLLPYQDFLLSDLRVVFEFFRDTKL